MGGKKRLALLGIFSTAALGALALAACSDDNKGTTVQATDAGTGGSDTGTVSDTGATKQTIKFGVSLGLTGALAGFSEGIQNSMRVTEEFINQNGGITDKNVQFVIEDDKTSKAEDLTAVITKFLTKDKVSAIIGPLGSGQVVASHEAVKAAHIIQLSPSATSPDLSVGSLFGGPDRYFFRTVPPDDFQGKAVARFAYAGPADAVVTDGGTPGCRRMAIISIDDAYGKSLVPVISAAFTGRPGASVVYKKEIPTDISGFTADAAKAIVTAMSALPDGPPECQAIIMYEDTAGRYMAAMNTQTAAQAAKFPAKFFTVGTDGIYTGGFLKESRSQSNDETSTNYANGVYGTNPDTNPTGRAQYDYFRTRYINKYPLAGGATDIPSFTANAFDAAVLAALAIQSAGGTSDPVKVRDALKAVANPPGTKYGPADFAAAMLAAKAGTDIDYQGASGDVDLKDPEGWSASGFIIWKATQEPGKAPTYSTKERITADQL